jgi:hypothetical protein
MYLFSARPARLFIFRSTLLTLALGLCSMLSSAQQPEVMAPHKPVAPRLPDSQPPASSYVPRYLRGGLWMTDAFTKSSVYIHTDLEISSLPVTPVLYLSNGVKLSLPAITLQPHGTAVININDSLANQGISPYATLSGYIELNYRWPWNVLCATISSVDATHSVVFTYGLSSESITPVPGGPAVNPSNSIPSAKILLGAWWKQEAGVTGFVSLSNTTDQPLPAAVEVTDANAKRLGAYRVTVSPHGTKRVELQELASVASPLGGLQVAFNGLPNALIVTGSLEDLSKGYSATIPFGFPPDASAKTVTSSYAEVGLMTGAADPMMHFPASTTFTPYSVLRNLGTQSVSVTPVIYWMEGGAAHSATQTPFTIAPLQTERLNTSALLNASGLNKFNGSFSLILEVQGPQNSVLLSSGSVDQSYTYVFEVIPSGVKESGSKNLSYWSTANGDDTMVTLWNPATEAQDFIYRFFFTGGQYALPVHLGPRAALEFNISEVIDAQSPDSDGNVIPLSAHEGSAQISGIQAENELILVAVAAGTYNVRKATCAYHCINCNGAVSWALQTLPFATTIGGSTQLTYQDTWNTGTHHNLTTSASWSSSNTSIAVVDTGDVSGVAIGNASITAQDTVDPWSGQVCGTLPSCPPDYGGIASGSGTVYDTTPVITGINPSDWNTGTTTNVTFGGQYFGTNAPTLSFSPSTGISYSLSSYNDTQIVALVTVASGTPNENVSVSVTNNGYGGVAFNGGSVGQSSKSAAVFATVHSPINSPEITVIAWVNGQAPDLNPLPSGANQLLVTNLNSSATTCAIEVAAWSVLLSPVDLHTSTDVAYANGWLVKYSANTAPPSTISPSAQLSAGNFRLFNDFGHGGGAYQVGKTPDPCGLSAPGFILNWISTGQASPYMGASGTSPSGKVYQLAEGRVGTLGQHGSQTINGGRTVPWIWSVIEFDSAGNPTYSDHAMFPTYSVYVNGTLAVTYPQSSVASFVANDQTYQRTPSQVP